MAHADSIKRQGIITMHCAAYSAEERCRSRIIWSSHGLSRGPRWSWPSVSGKTWSQPPCRGQRRGVRAPSHRRCPPTGLAPWRRPTPAGILMSCDLTESWTPPKRARRDWPDASLGESAC